MTQPGTVEVVVNHQKVSDVADSILRTLHDEQVAVGYGLLGAILTVGRLSQITHPLTPEQEIHFIQDALDWCGMYWGEGSEKVVN